MSSDQPHFRFNPGVYQKGRSFTASQVPCEVCTKACVWEYTGSIYAQSRPTVCARCISNGRLAAFLADEAFALHDIVMTDVESALAQEILQRTPGVACFNPYDWPVQGGKPLAFIGYGDDISLIAVPSVREAIERAFDPLGLNFGPTPHALIFKELDSDCFRVVVDLD